MIEWHPRAQVDFNDARRWYWARSEQAFLKFLDAVEEAIERLVSHGDTFAVIGRGCRAIRIKNYPHRIIYFIHPSGTIRIIAVQHDRRRPLLLESSDQVIDIRPVIQPSLSRQSTSHFLPTRGYDFPLARKCSV